MDETETTSPKPLAVNALSMGGAEYQRTLYHVEVTPDVTVEDLLTPEFWQHHSDRLRRMDLVDVVNNDLTLDVQLRVHAVDTGLVTMAIRFDASIPADLELEDETAGDEQAETPATLPPGYKTNFNPNASGHKWRVIWRTGAAEPVEIATADTKAEVIAAAIEHAAKAKGLAA